jgi:dihydrolipoamide dehydrogenase
VYTVPEISTIGMSLEAARGAGFSAVSGIAKYAANGKALAEGEDEGFVQLVADGVSGRVLGAQIVGARAVELIAVVRPFLAAGANVNEIADVVFSHPTLSEVIRSAAEVTESKLK